MKSNARKCVACLVLLLFVSVATASSVTLKDGNPSIVKTEQNANSTPAKSQDGKFVITQNGVKYLAERLTRERIDQMKSQIGVRDPSENYNVLVNGMGTGLAPPTEEEWNDLEGQIIIDRVIHDDGVTLGAPSSADLSQDIYFPPVGHQGTQGSCAAWAMTYYTYGYLEAKDNGWNANSGNTQYLMSPAWTYNRVNGGQKLGGSTGYSNGLIITHWGTATLNSMPYNQDDWTSWGSDNAWREAPLHRGQSVYSIAYSGDPTVDAVKNLVAGGTPVTFAIDSDQFDPAYAADNNWIISAAEYNSATVNHAQTIVGYDNSLGENGEVGSFKVVNSWGASWGLSGFYWLTYEAFKEIGSLLQLCCISDRSTYVPHLLASWRFSSSPTRDAIIKVGLGPYASPIMEKEPYYYFGSSETFPTFMALDITEFLPSYTSSYLTFFLSVGGATTAGTISSFRIEKYDPLYTVGYPNQTSPESSDVPKSTPGYVTSTPGFITTILPVFNDDVYTFDITVPAGGYYYFTWSLSSGDGVYGNYSVAAAQGCSFFICNSSNFATYQNNPNQLPPTYYCYIDDQGSGSWTFLVPHTDTWYLIFSNTYWIWWAKNVHCYFCLDLTGPTITITNPMFSSYSAGDTISLSASATDDHFTPASMSVSVKNSSGSVLFLYSVSAATIAVGWAAPTTLFSGYYNVTFSSYDGAGNLNRGTLRIWIQNWAPPTIDQPLAVTFVAGTTGNTITWHPSSPNNFPGSYSIMNSYYLYTYGTKSPTSSQLGSGTWNGGAITQNMDSLTVGTHELNCTVHDSNGKKASSIVTVTVQPKNTWSVGVNTNDWMQYTVTSNTLGTYGYDWLKSGTLWKLAVLDTGDAYGCPIMDADFAAGAKCDFYINGIKNTTFSPLNESISFLTYPILPSITPSGDNFWNTYKNWLSSKGYSTYTITIGSKNVTFNLSQSYGENTQVMNTIIDKSSGVTLASSLVLTNSTGSYTYTYVLTNTNIEGIIARPTINQPSAITYTVGTSGHTATWSPFSKIPDHYTISVNGSSPTSYNWNGGTITYSVDGWPTGTYTVTCTVYDNQGRSVSSSVIVTVQTSSAGDGGTGAEATTMLLIAAAACIAIAGVLVGFILIRKKKA